MTLELLLFIFVLTSTTLGCLVPASWLPTLPNDKVLHFLAFAVLAFLAGRIAQDWWSLGGWLLGLLSAGWVIEILQNWVPGRKFCWRDMAADTAGIVVAAFSSRMVLGY